jgi:ATP-dependent Clp protease ATP-binding subunit ClpC
MFEHFTEKARRVIFFARYEAIQLGSPFIETEHLLLGLLREIPEYIVVVAPKIDFELLREELGQNKGGHFEASMSADLPLSNESKCTLAYAAEEAERLCQRNIGTNIYFSACFARKRATPHVLSACMVSASLRLAPVLVRA